MNAEIAGLTVDNRAGAKVLTEQVHIQCCTGEDHFQCGDLLKHISHFSEQEVSQTVALMHLVLFKHSKSVYHVSSLSSKPNSNLQLINMWAETPLRRNITAPENLVFAHHQDLVTSLLGSTRERYKTLLFSLLLCSSLKNNPSFKYSMCLIKQDYRIDQFSKTVCSLYL